MARRPRRPRRVAEQSAQAFAGRHLLLDTHALLWWLSGDRKMSHTARAAVSNQAAVVLVSAASAWEIATKVRLGRLEDRVGIVDALGNVVAGQGFRPLPITLEHGRRAGALPGPHKDPFDRMLIAQAQADGLTVVSNETVFDSYGIGRIW